MIVTFTTAPPYWQSLCTYLDLDTCDFKILNGVKGGNRVLYDISPPPASIEWE
ncbi:MAG: hypothetical protein LAT79_13455 [Kiritimatiellae bacterium]|nr:hypothetical protein [Kiritimatiellia bacterium]